MKKKTRANVLWNGTGILLGMVAGFLLAPFLVHRLGMTRYGLWVLIGTFDGYFGLLDFGVRSSVGRHIAYRLGKSDKTGLSATFRAALAIQCCVGCATLIITAAALFLFFHLFHVPPEQAKAVRLALGITGLCVALEFPLTVFDATLWGLNRFDLLNFIDIPIIVVRTGFTFFLISRGYGLIALALINLGTMAVAECVKACFVYRLISSFGSLRPRFEPQIVRELFQWGSWYFVLSLARTLNSQISLLIIGAMLAVELVTPYSIATRMVGYAVALLTATTDVITPVATGLHARGDRQGQQQLLLVGGMYCTGLSIMAAVLIVTLGGPFMSLWIGHEAGAAVSLLPLLAVGCLIPMTQRVSYGIVLAMGNHKPIAILGLLETMIAAALAIAVARPFGVWGICLAFALPALLNRGVVQFIYGCKCAGVGIIQCLGQAILWPTTVIAIPTALFAIVISRARPHNWPELFLATGSFIATSGIVWHLLNRAKTELTPSRLETESLPFAVPGTIEST